MDLDGVLKELGQFGRYQIQLFILLFFPLIFCSITSMTYVFTAGDIEYRCIVDECEPNDTTIYQTDWLKWSAPFQKSNTADHCLRYKVNKLEPSANCTKDSFTVETEKCEHFVYKNDEDTITKEFGLLCDENKWKRTIVGTLNNVGLFIGMPIAGIVSDKFGRKAMILGSVLLSAICGTIRSLTTSYIQFLIMEVLDAMVYSGLYSGLFVYSMEIIGPDKRGIGGAIISSFYSIGEMILGLVVWIVPYWRIYLRILYIPAFVIVFYYWCFPESIRWLLSHKKHDKLIEGLNSISQLNKKEMSEETKNSIKDLTMSSDNNQIKQEKQDTTTESKPEYPLKEVLFSKTLVLRVLNCSFCWMTHTFVFYGLSLNSVGIAGNKYLNFILVSFVEIPGYILSWLMADLCGRRLSVVIGLIVSGAACTGFHFIQKDDYAVQLSLYLIGKLAITESFTTLYILASEFYPTHLRHSLMSFCSTLARVGSMIAPQTPLLSPYVDPVLLFGCISLLAGILSFYFPETRHCKLPDTIEEAENIGKKKVITEHKSENGKYVKEAMP